MSLISQAFDTFLALAPALCLQILQPVFHGNIAVGSLEKYDLDLRQQFTLSKPLSRNSTKRSRDTSRNEP